MVFTKPTGITFRKIRIHITKTWSSTVGMSRVVHTEIISPGSATFVALGVLGVNVAKPRHVITMTPSFLGEPLAVVISTTQTVGVVGVSGTKVITATIPAIGVS